MLNFTEISEYNFETKALELFRFQVENVEVYKNYISFLDIDIHSISRLEDIPFLPISFFKTHEVITTNLEIEQTFLSSGTGNSERSKHHISDLKIYEKSFINSFNFFYKDFSSYRVQALLPSYLENGDSSLIYMIDYFIKHSKNKKSAFVTEEELIQNTRDFKNEKTLIIGVSYALLDLAEKHQLNFSNCIVMETGGMKGRRKEWTREELHKEYKKSFNVSEIHSEYGMTELLSQAYSKGNGIFNCPPWMKVISRPYNEPFTNQKSGNTGILKVIDLANIYSCAFIETADLGKIHLDNSFEILGRIDFEDIRGCNLLIH